MLVNFFIICYCTHYVPGRNIRRAESDYSVSFTTVTSFSRSKVQIKCYRGELVILTETKARYFTVHGQLKFHHMGVG